MLVEPIPNIKETNMKSKTACIQLNAQNNMAKNIAKAIEFIREAADIGAKFITLPENCVFMGESAEDLFSNSYTEDKHPALPQFCKVAKELKIWLLVGSIAIKVKNSDKLANRSFLIDDNGNVATKYDKIHLYDVSVTDGESHRESERYIAGDTAKLIKTPFGNLGLTICYDLRFPYLYRSLAQKGADIITVPAAFTKFTGKAHWHVLLRARAIENSCYIIAPAMTGNHPKDRQTFGHSLIIDPWGEILADGSENEGVIIADIDTDKVSQTRKQIASLQHDKDFVVG